MFLGPKNPYKITASAMVTSPRGNGVIVIGGVGGEDQKKNHFSEKALFELRGNSIESLKWIQLKQTLEYGRRYHMAVPVPDEMTTSTQIVVPDEMTTPTPVPDEMTASTTGS